MFFVSVLKDMKPDCADKVLGEFWDFMDNGILSPQGMADKIDAHGAEQKWLEQKTASLSLPGVLYNPQGDMSLFTGCYKVIGGMFSPGASGRRDYGRVFPSAADFILPDRIWQRYMPPVCDTGG